MIPGIINYMPAGKTLGAFPSIHDAVTLHDYFKLSIPLRLPYSISPVNRSNGILIIILLMFRLADPRRRESDTVECLVRIQPPDPVPEIKAKAAGVGEVR